IENNSTFYLLLKQFHNFIWRWILLLPLFIFTGCSKSPEKEGKELAQRMNENFETYIRERHQAEAEFISKFKAANYSTRYDALKEFDSYMADLSTAHYNRETEINEAYSNASLKYIGDRNINQLDAFETAYNNNIDQQLKARMQQIMKDHDYPDAVLSAIRTIIPVKPEPDKIIEDLLSEKISEGFPREICWFSEDQRWTLANYKINNFSIEEVLKDTDREYIIIATMRLENDHNAFDARVKISYILPDDDDWQMEFVNSLGLLIVQTHKYDDLVSYKIADDGWGGVNALIISNNSNIELVVGVDFVANGNRYRRSVQVSPDKKAQVGGTFGGGNVTSYQIGFVERL
nr:hypothetical protein [Muribaculaceae bacterium]